LAINPRKSRQANYNGEYDHTGCNTYRVSATGVIANTIKVMAAGGTLFQTEFSDCGELRCGCDLLLMKVWRIMLNRDQEIAHTRLI